jgi:hypothetical protein
MWTEFLDESQSCLQDGEEIAKVTEEDKSGLID